MEKQPVSCWSLTTKVVMGIAVLMVLTWLAGSPGTSALLASAG